MLEKPWCLRCSDFEPPCFCVASSENVPLPLRRGVHFESILAPSNPSLNSGAFPAPAEPALPPAEPALPPAKPLAPDEPTAPAPLLAEPARARLPPLPALPGAPPPPLPAIELVVPALPAIAALPALLGVAPALPALAPPLAASFPQPVRPDKPKNNQAKHAVRNI